jgi:hypothetical protein
MRSPASLLVLLYFVGRWLVAPLAVAALALYSAASRKRTRRELGGPLIDVPIAAKDTPRIGRIPAILGISALVGTAARVAFAPTARWMGLILFLPFLMFFAAYIQSWAMASIRGLYCNGVVSTAEPLFWSAVHSWQRVGNRFLVLRKDGLRDDFDVASNADKLERHLQGLGIPNASLRRLDGTPLGDR